LLVGATNTVEENGRTLHDINVQLWEKEEWIPYIGCCGVKRL